MGARIQKLMTEVVCRFVYTKPLHRWRRRRAKSSMWTSRKISSTATCKLNGLEKSRSTFWVYKPISRASRISSRSFDVFFFFSSEKGWRGGCDRWWPLPPTRRRRERLVSIIIFFLCTSVAESLHRWRGRRTLCAGVKSADVVGWLRSRAEDRQYSSGGVKLRTGAHKSSGEEEDSVKKKVSCVYVNERRRRRRNGAENVSPPFRARCK